MSLYIIIPIIILVVLVIAFLVWQLKDIVTTKYVFKNGNLSNALDGFNILHISDLHNNNCQKRLVSIIENQSPDIIVVSGDLIDSDKTNVGTALKLISRIITIAPIYYVQGNHEARLKTYIQFAASLRKSGVNVLDNTSATFCYKNTIINLVGIISPIYKSDFSSKLEKSEFNCIKTIINSNVKKGVLNILLAHNPEQLALYSQCNVDLVFSGHAHGGMIRLPFIGGIIAPNQGLFPKYTSGIHKANGTSMVISRGVGNHFPIFRIFNRPEVVVVTLKSK